ncbi:MAG: hypothetical protein RLZ71_403 [Actinomycetota bacterium]|jgi:hypothetical protein
MFVAFVDESKARNYLLAVTLIHPRDLPKVRTALLQLRKPGQRRIHFSKENDRRRRQVLSAINSLPVMSFVVQSDKENEGQARAECLEKLIFQAAERKLHRIVIERDYSFEKADLRVIRSALSVSGLDTQIEYAHENPHEEPALWIPDAVAWSFVKGGEWKARLKLT